MPTGGGTGGVAAGDGAVAMPVAMACRTNDVMSVSIWSRVVAMAGDVTPSSFVMRIGGIGASAAGSPQMKPLLLAFAFHTCTCAPSYCLAKET